MQIEVRECLLSFCAESFNFQFGIQKFKIKIQRIIILYVVLYGCGTWSLILREIRRLRVFQNRVLRRIFWPKRNQVRGSGENYSMRSSWYVLLAHYCLGDNIEKSEMGKPCTGYGWEERPIQNFGGEN